jgi:hypothetical protein
MKKIHVAILMAAEAVLLCAGVAVAARNSSGTMVAISGPYTAGSVISAAVVNARLADIENELTNSVDKGGRTVMTAPLPLSNGTVSLPSLTFGSDTDTGIYRIGANNLGVTAAGAKVLDVATTGLGVTGTLTVGGTVSGYALDVSAINGFDNARFGTQLVMLGTLPSVGFNLHNDGSGNKYITTNFGGYLSFDQTAGSFIFYTAPSGTAAAAATTTERFRVNPSGVTIGTSGTAVKHHMVGTVTWNPGTISACGAGPCLTGSTTISMSGVATGNPCYAGVYDPAPLSGWPVQCITTANTCSLMIVNQSNVNKAFGSATFYCVVDVL